MTISSWPDSDAYVKSIRSGDWDVQTKPLVIRYASPESIKVDLGIDGGKMEVSLWTSPITRLPVRQSPLFPMQIAGILRTSTER